MCVWDVYLINRWKFKEVHIVTKCGILFQKLFWPTVRKNCSSDREKLLKFEAEGREFAKQWKVTTIISNKLEQLEFKLEKNIGI